MDFDNDDNFERHHYAFRVTDQEFDENFGRIKNEGIFYGSGPSSPEDMEINYRRSGRGCYFRDLDGHLLEIKTT